jgi:hypothetical protein
MQVLGENFAVRHFQIRNGERFGASSTPAFVWHVGVTVHARMVREDAKVLLSVLQFYHIFTLLESVRDAVHQVPSQAGREAATAAAMIGSVTNPAPFATNELECGICMDSTIQIALPCLHSYCQKCYDEWTAHNATCPMCRASLVEANQDEFWQFTDAPAEADINNHKAELLEQIRCFAARLPRVRVVAGGNPPPLPPPPLPPPAAAPPAVEVGVAVGVGVGVEVEDGAREDNLFSHA